MSKNEKGDTNGDAKLQKSQKAQKAAKIILALGDENAAPVLQHLDDKSIGRIAAEIAKINSLPASERKDVLKEFADKIEEVKLSESGGLHKASQFLTQAFDVETAKERLKQLRDNLSVNDFSDFEEYQPETLVKVLEKELPRTTGLVLTRLEAAFSARVLSLFEEKYRAQVAMQIAKISTVSPELLKTLHTSLKKKLDTMEDERTIPAGGEGKLAEIMRHMDRSSERNLVEILGQDDSDMVIRLKKKLTVFDDIAQLSAKEVRKIVEKIPDKNTWAAALAGVGTELLRHILGSLSVNRSSNITEQMEVADTLPVKEIDNARRAIITVMENAEEAGEIVIRKDREELIE
ncbi:MAG: FliG C-terminal domain-containing protein [Leptospirales bacterium]